MAKKKISQPDLTWIVVEQMRAGVHCPVGLSLAIVPDTNEGWRVVVETRSRKSLGINGEQKLEAIQNQLRELYTLVDK